MKRITYQKTARSTWEELPAGEGWYTLQDAVAVADQLGKVVNRAQVVDDKGQALYDTWGGYTEAGRAI